MVARLSRILWLGCVVLLAGCFQQAGESLQPIENTATPVQPTLDSTNTEPETDATPQLIIATSAADDEATPTPGTLSTVVPAQQSGQPTLPPITVIVQPTTAPITPTDVDEPTPINLSGSSGFITPVSPLGAAIETVQPETSSGGSAPTPSGLITPTDFFSSNSTTTTSSSTSTGDTCTYTVASGDTVYRIAIENGTTVAAMREANPDLTGDNPVIQPGDVLNLPICGGPDTGVTAATPTDIPPIVAPSGNDGPVTQSETYTVQPGDTLFIIAQRFGTTVAALTESNELANPNRLSVGQVLTIPGS